MEYGVCKGGVFGVFICYLFLKAVTFAQAAGTPLLAPPKPETGVSQPGSAEYEEGYAASPKLDPPEAT